MFFLAFVCVLAGCQEDTVEFNSNELVSSDKLTYSSNYGDFPAEVNDMIANGGAGHFGCKASDKMFLLHSSLPCQPNIPYFLFSFVNQQGATRFATDYSATFFLVVNPNYNSHVKVVDINWDLNGENDPVPVKSFTINNLQMGESNSVTCEVFSTDNKSSTLSNYCSLILT